MKKLKISNMLIDVAREYVAMGDDIEEKQCLLNDAVYAWNMACLEDKLRMRALKKYLKAFKKANPHATKQDVEDMGDNLKMLIRQKILKYPDVNVSLAQADIKLIGDKLHITVASIREK